MLAIQRRSRGHGAAARAWFAAGLDSLRLGVLDLLLTVLFTAVFITWLIGPIMVPALADQTVDPARLEAYGFTSWQQGQEPECGGDEDQYECGDLPVCLLGVRCGWVLNRSGHSGVPRPRQPRSPGRRGRGASVACTERDAATHSNANAAARAALPCPEANVPPEAEARRAASN